MDTRKKFILTFAVVALALAAFYFATQFSTFRIIDNDGHFHIRYSNLMFERGLPDKLPELKFTTWGQSYRDHHLLFHVLYMPFSLFPDIRIGAKLAAAFFATIAGIVFFWALVSFRVRMPVAWLALFAAGSTGFLFRIQMPRIQSLALALTLAVIVFMVRRRYWLVIIFSAVNVWLYDSFFLLFILGVLWCAASRLADGEYDLKMLVFIAAGVVFATVANPYFPDNYASYYFSLKRSLAPYGTIPLPAEWHPETGWRMFIDNLPIVASCLLIAVVSLLANEKFPASPGRNGKERLFVMFVMLFYIVLLLHSRRFIEYAPAMVVLFTAVIHRDMASRCPRGWQNMMTAVIAAAAVTGSAATVSQFLKDTRTGDTYHCYMEAGKWISEHAGKEDVVFSSDWDDFPMLYMNAPRMKYVVGMDPLFLLRYDEKLYELYSAITRGVVAGPYTDEIKNVFTSKYVFTDEEHKRFIREFEKDKGVAKVFDGDECRVYEIAE